MGPASGHQLRGSLLARSRRLIQPGFDSACDRLLPTSNSASRQIVARLQWPSESGWTSQTERRKLVRIDTLSQSVRPSPQLAESEPIRVSVASLRNMSGERK